MNFLEERIVKDGIVKSGNVLKVESFTHKNKNQVIVSKKFLHEGYHVESLVIVDAMDAETGTITFRDQEVR